MSGSSRAAALRCAFAYASPRVQYLVELELPVGATAAAARAAARQALEAGRGTLQVAVAATLAAGTGRAAALAEIPWEDGECSVFGRLVDWHAPLRDGDRVEILRALQADPRVSRRKRVAEARRSTPGPWLSGGSGRR
jgi:putative ubiquitin-RnfH superfamily antitoxin RatB of RatAB toxin-antitoxin module